MRGGEKAQVMGGLMAHESGTPSHRYPFFVHHINHPRPSHPPHPHPHEKDYPQEILELRNEIRQKSIISLDKRYVFLLYYPPGYPIEATANYISSRLKLPVELLLGTENNHHADYYLHELLTNSTYKNGWIICNYPSNVHEINSLKRLLDSENSSLNILYFDLDGEVCISLNLLSSSLSPSLSSFLSLS